MPSPRHNPGSKTGRKNKPYTTASDNLNIGQYMIYRFISRLLTIRICTYGKLKKVEDVVNALPLCHVALNVESGFWRISGPFNFLGSGCEGQWQVWLILPGIHGIGLAGRDSCVLSAHCSALRLSLPKGYRRFVEPTASAVS